MEYSKFNDPMNYMRVTRELIDMGIPGTAIFAAKSDESINHVKASYCLTSIDELDKLLDDIDLVIIENIALSKYLNSLQIYEYVILRGFNITRVNLRKKINNLIRHRIIQENEIILRGAEHGIKYYELDHFGYIIARHQGVYFHMGNRYISFSKKTGRKHFTGYSSRCQAYSGWQSDCSFIVNKRCNNAAFRNNGNYEKHKSREWNIYAQNSSKCPYK